MPRDRKNSEDKSAIAKKRTRRDSSASPKRESDKSNYSDSLNILLSESKKRDEKRDDKKSIKKEKSPSKKTIAVEKEVDHVKTRRMSQAADQLASTVDQEGLYENFPQITPKTVELLKKRGISGLFPVQYSSFNHIWNRKDLIVRDLTGSGKTLGFALPTVEYLRKNKLFGTRKI